MTEEEIKALIEELYGDRCTLASTNMALVMMTERMLGFDATDLARQTLALHSSVEALIDNYDNEAKRLGLVLQSAKEDAEDARKADL